MSETSDQNNGWDSHGSGNTSSLFNPHTGACFSWTFYIDSSTQILSTDSLPREEFFHFSDDEEDGDDRYSSLHGSYVNSEAHALSFPHQELEEDEYSDSLYDSDSSFEIIVLDIDEEGLRTTQPASVVDASNTMPATKESIERLDKVKIEDPSLTCAVCMEDLHIGSGAKRMPCLHVYHENCIDQWLVIKNSCPICRRQMATDDN